MTYLDLTKREGKGFDVYDGTVDTFGIYIEPADDDEKLDDYGKFILLISALLEVKEEPECKEDYSVVCDVWGFVEKHYELLKSIFEKINSEYFQLNRKDKDRNIEIAMQSLSNLIAGEYCDEDYTKFVTMFEANKNVRSLVLRGLSDEAKSIYEKYSTIASCKELANTNAYKEMRGEAIGRLIEIERVSEILCDGVINHDERKVITGEIQEVKRKLEHEFAEGI